MQTRSRGANFASSGASNSAINLISLGIPPHYTGPGYQTFFLKKKVNGPISHQLFPGKPADKGLKCEEPAATDLHLEVTINRRCLQFRCCLVGVYMYIYIHTYLSVRGGSDGK